MFCPKKIPLARDPGVYVFRLCTQRNPLWRAKKEKSKKVLGVHNVGSLS